MKNLVLALVLSLSTGAYASFFVVNCSSADGSFKSVSGHLPSKTSITYNGGITGDEIEFILQDYSEKVLKEVLLDSKSSSHCEEGSTSGYAVWKNTSYKEVEITLNGENDIFPNEIPNVSNDRKKLFVQILCINEGNSRSSCK